jgi:hypothetical protein
LEKPSETHGETDEVWNYKVEYPLGLEDPVNLCKYGLRITIGEMFKDMMNKHLIQGLASKRKLNGIANDVDSRKSSDIDFDIT